MGTLNETLHYIQVFAAFFLLWIATRASLKVVTGHMPFLPDGLREAVAV